MKDQIVLEGKIEAINFIVTVKRKDGSVVTDKNGNEMKKRSFIVNTRTEGKYPNYVQIEAIASGMFNTVKLLDGYSEGEFVRVFCNIKGGIKIYEVGEDKRVYQSVELAGIERLSISAPPPAQKSAEKVPEEPDFPIESDDLPF